MRDNCVCILFRCYVTQTRKPKHVDKDKERVGTKQGERYKNGTSGRNNDDKRLKSILQEKNCHTKTRNPNTRDNELEKKNSDQGEDGEKARPRRKGVNISDPVTCLGTI